MALYVFQCLRYFFVSRVATKKQHGGYPWRVDIANTKYVEAGYDVEVDVSSAVRHRIAATFGLASYMDDLYLYLTSAFGLFCTFPSLI